LQLAATLLTQGVLGVLPAEQWPTVNWLIVALWVAVLVATVAADGFNAIVWLVLLVILAVNTLTITFSPRMIWGPIVVTVERYYFELLFLVALFLAIVIRRATVRTTGANPRAGGAVVAAAWLAVAVSAWTSGQSFYRLVNSARYHGLQHARTYAANLRAEFADIRRTQAGTLDFADGRVPDDVVGLAALRVGGLSKFLRVFDPAVRVSKGKPVCLRRAGGWHHRQAAGRMLCMTGVGRRRHRHGSCATSCAGRADEPSCGAPATVGQGEKGVQQRLGVEPVPERARMLVPHADAQAVLVVCAEVRARARHGQSELLRLAATLS
jgi:hypothetical protein